MLSKNSPTGRPSRVEQVTALIVAITGLIQTIWPIALTLIDSLSK